MFTVRTKASGTTCSAWHRIKPDFHSIEQIGKEIIIFQAEFFSKESIKFTKLSPKDCNVSSMQSKDMGGLYSNIMEANVTVIDGKKYLILYLKDAAEPALYKIDLRNTEDFFKDALVTPSFKNTDIFESRYSKYCVVNGKMIIFDQNKRDKEPFFFVDIKNEVIKSVIDLSAYGKLTSVDNLKCIE